MIALAGGIGSGKSVVSRILRLKGYGVFDCDSEAKKIMEEDTDIRIAVEGALGEKVYGPGGLDRARMARIIFTDATKRDAVNRLVHSAVRKRIMHWSAESKNNLFVESAITAQSGILEMAGEVWWIEAHPDTRRERAVNRDGSSGEKVERIMEAQEREKTMIMDSEKRVRVIVNDGDTSLLDQLEKLL